ncbi:MAG: hypothetical protein ACREOH_04920, partial [Candidatus Entotheonellia bacterium]
GVVSAVEAIVALVQRLSGQNPTPMRKDPTLEDLYWRDEILQLMYWLTGEGLVDVIAAQDLRRFLEIDPGRLEERLSRLAADGYLELGSGRETNYRLSALGIEEGRRRFLDEFTPFLGRESHNPCGDPECACHTSGGECTNLRGR